MFQSEGERVHRMNAEALNESPIEQLLAKARRLEAEITGQPFLKGLTEQHLTILANYAMETKFAAGQLIFREGDVANRFYLILEGKVTLEAEARDAAPVPIMTIGAGDVLGWSWLFPPYCWHFDARAVEPTKAIFFYGTWLREQCEMDHSLGYELVKRMAEVVIQRLQATRRQLADTSRFALEAQYEALRLATQAKTQCECGNGRKQKT